MLIKYKEIQPWRTLCQISSKNWQKWWNLSPFLHEHLFYGEMIPWYFWFHGLSPESKHLTKHRYWLQSYASNQIGTWICFCKYSFFDWEKRNTFVQKQISFVRWVGWPKISCCNLSFCPWSAQRTYQFQYQNKSCFQCQKLKIQKEINYLE